MRVLPITGAAISTLSAPFGTETICASDAAAARLDEIQFDLGEGPCWDALATRRPVLTSDIRHQLHPAWPVFLLDIGAVDLYSQKPGTLTSGQVDDATTLAGIAARQVLRRVLLTHTMMAVPETDDGYSRRVVHQATGMVLAQLNVPASDALLILQGYAFSHGRTVGDVADDVVARKLDFTSELGGS
jgi:hypothetical protein